MCSANGQTRTVASRMNIYIYIRGPLRQLTFVLLNGRGHTAPPGRIKHTVRLALPRTQNPDKYVRIALETSMLRLRVRVRVVRACPQQRRI